MTFFARAAKQADKGNLQSALPSLTCCCEGRPEEEASKLLKHTKKRVKLIDSGSA
jgi:hypothetical protein